MLNPPLPVHSSCPTLQWWQLSQNSHTHLNHAKHVCRRALYLLFIFLPVFFCMANHFHSKLSRQPLVFADAHTEHYMCFQLWFSWFFIWVRFLEANICLFIDSSIFCYLKLLTCLSMDWKTDWRIDWLVDIKDWSKISHMLDNCYFSLKFKFSRLEFHIWHSQGRYST